MIEQNDIPKVQNMDNYLIKHYRSYIVQELNKRLVNGELAELIDVPIASELILPDECNFRRFSYWRLNQCDFLIDIDLRMELLVQTPDGSDTDFFCFCVELWFSFNEDEEECEFQSISMLEDRPDHDGHWKLDRFLVPILRRDEIDQYAEDIWSMLLPEAAKDQKLRNPNDLAGKLHLSLVNLPLYRRGDTKGILFFHESTVLTQQERIPGERDESEPTEVSIPANTIVINSCTKGGPGSDLDIYHECIHFIWHYLFYRLQNLHNNDVKLSSAKKKNSSDPIGFMEAQARYGSYALMMPKTFMKQTIKALYKEAFEGKRKDGYFNHDGYRYDYIARQIANKYLLPKAIIRARMIQLGINAAQGALNFVDGHYIVPFAFSDIGNCSSDDTYVIDRKTVMRLYKEDKEFRSIMQSGKFSYVDGHVVFCESDNVVETESGTFLSGWANAHIDRVSLRFSKTYLGSKGYTYTFGEMNNKEAVENAFKFLDVSGKMTIQELQKAADLLMKDMPATFHGTLSYLMKGRCTIEKLMERIPISKRTLVRLRTEERKQYSLDQIVAICIGLHLPPWLSEILLEKAHLSVKRTGPQSHYGIILDCYFMDTIQDVQEFLKSGGFDPLDLHFEVA